MNLRLSTNTAPTHVKLLLMTCYQSVKYYKKISCHRQTIAVITWKSCYICQKVANYCITNVYTIITK